MSSFDKLLLLTFSALALILVAESHRTILLEKEENEEAERLLKHINKPAIKSFHTERGDVFDCIDIQKQLAFDHPLLKNHSIQLKPTAIPKSTISYNNYSESGSFLLFPQENINCPHGTVIVKRTTMEDLIQDERLKSMGNKFSSYASSKFAVAEYKFSNFGAKANVNVWEPEVSSDQMSLGGMTIVEDSREKLQMISAGWIVYQWLNKNHCRLYSTWTTDGFKTTGCYNTLCPGFVQVSTKFPLGFLFDPVSISRGPQYALSVNMYKDQSTGNWWLDVQGVHVGYWPKSLFPDDGRYPGLGREASKVSWGGHVYSPVKEKSPQMGSGSFPNEGYRRAAFVNDIQVVDYVTGQLRSPQLYDLETNNNAPDCYEVVTRPIVGFIESTSVFYGGPGGCTF